MGGAGHLEASLQRERSGEGLGPGLLLSVLALPAQCLSRRWRAWAGLAVESDTRPRLRRLIGAGVQHLRQGEVAGAKPRVERQLPGCRDALRHAARQAAKPTVIHQAAWTKHGRIEILHARVD